MTESSVVICTRGKIEPVSHSSATLVFAERSLRCSYQSRHWKVEIVQSLVGRSQGATAKWFNKEAPAEFSGAQGIDLLKNHLLLKVGKFLGFAAME